MDKDVLLKPRLAEEEVDISGVGVVRVRALTRREALEIRKNVEEEVADGPRALAIERYMLSKAMVDPQLSEEEVRQWQEAAQFGELNQVAMVVQRLSGLDEAASREAYKSS